MDGRDDMRALRVSVVKQNVLPLRSHCSMSLPRCGQALAAGNGPYDEKGLRPHRDRVGQRSVRLFVGQVLLAGEESYKRGALLRDVIADRPAQHRIAGLERVEDRALRGLTLAVERHLAVDVRQRPQTYRDHDS